MIVFYPYHQEVPPRRCILLCLVFCSVTWPCDSTDTCPVVTKALSQHPWFADGTTCFFHDGDVTDCTVLCAARPGCKMAKKCPGCVRCKYCDYVAEVSFTVPSETFYLHNMEIAVEVFETTFPKALIQGVPLLLKVRLIGDQVVIKFSRNDGTVCFRTRFYFGPELVKTESLSENTWTSEDMNTPHFNFQQGQEISMLYFFNSRYPPFQLYIDNVKFHESENDFIPLNLRSVSIWSSNEESKIVSCRL